MLPRTYPSVEQLEARCIPSVVAAVPLAVHDPQTMLAVAQTARGHVDSVAAVLPSIAASSPIHQPPVAVSAPPPIAAIPPTALPLETAAAPEAVSLSEAMEQVTAAEPAPAPAADPSVTPAVVVVTAVEPESDFVVPAVADVHTEPVRAPSIPLDRPAREPAVTADAPAHECLPMLVWMVGLASVVALHAERRRGGAVFPLAG